MPNKSNLVNTLVPLKILTNCVLKIKPADDTGALAHKAQVRIQLLGRSRLSGSDAAGNASLGISLSLYVGKICSAWPRGDREERREKADNCALPKDCSFPADIVQEAHKGSCCTQLVQGKPPRDRENSQTRSLGKWMTFCLLSKKVLFSARSSTSFSSVKSRLSRKAEEKKIKIQPPPNHMEA